MIGAVASLIFLAGQAPPVPTIGVTLPDTGDTAPPNVAVTFEVQQDENLTTLVLLTSAMGGYSGPAAQVEGVWSFDPGASLAAGAWSATIDVSNEYGDTTKSFSFTVAGSDDVTAPEIPFAPALELGEYRDLGPACEECPDPGPYWQVHATWDATTDASPFVYVVKGVIGETAERFLAAPPAAPYTVHIAAIDAAGNTGLSPEATIDVPGEPEQGDPAPLGCGCSLARRAPAGRAWLAALVIAAVLVRRRR